MCSSPSPSCGEGMRSFLLKQQQDLAPAGLHRATALTKVADHLKTEDLLVEPRGSGYVADIQRGFEEAIAPGTHADILA